MARTASGMAAWALLGGLLFMFLMGSLGTAAAAPALPPLETVQACINRTLEILGSSISEDGKVLQLRKEVGSCFDFREMAKRALGQHRSRATEAERAEFEQLFIRVLEERYLTRTIFSEARGVRAVYTKPKIDGDFAEVKVKFFTPKDGEHAVSWRLHAVGNAWKIYDMNAEGVGLIANYRAQFTKMLAGGRPFPEFLNDFRTRIDRAEARRE